MIIDLSCPIELRGYEIMHDDAGVARTYIDLFNVSDDTLSAYGATVRWMRDETGESLSDNVTVDEIAIPGGGMFRLVLLCSAIKDADRLEMYFTRAVFQNCAVWEPKDGDLVDVGEFIPLEGEELVALKAAAGEDAYCYPEVQDEFWRCVCGRINPLSSDECVRCRRERAYVLNDLNRKVVDLDDDAMRQREERIVRSKRASAKSVDAKNKVSLYVALLGAAVLVFTTLAILVAIL